MPRRVFDMGRGLVPRTIVDPTVDENAIFIPSGAPLTGVGCGATMWAPTQVRRGDHWINPSAGVEESESFSDSASFTFSATESPSPTGTDECAPARPRQDEAEARRIRAEKRLHQTQAEARARALLVEVIGEAAVQTLEAGGTYAVPSVRWPGTEYHIPKSGYIKVVRDGMWQVVCLVSNDHYLPWADVVLSRIKMIEANETIVQGRGNKQGSSPNRTLTQLKNKLEALFNQTRRNPQGD